MRMMSIDDLDGTEAPIRWIARRYSWHCDVYEVARRWGPALVWPVRVRR